MKTISDKEFKALSDLVQIAREFIRRVEDKEVRSLYTYNAMKRATRFLFENDPEAPFSAFEPKVGDELRNPQA